MKIALIGYGNMGKMVDDIVSSQKKHEIVSISFANGMRDLDENGIGKADVIIDFTSPEVIMKTFEKIIPLRIPIVVGTTGWFDALPEISEMVRKCKSTLVYGGNFSIGANLFFHITKYASSLFQQFSEYDVYGLEIHHTGKKDSPSGTAIKLADIIMKEIPRKKTIQTDRLDRKITPSELHFASVRGGVNNGEHQVFFDSTADVIMLKHHAHTRRGFAEGALLAAEFVQNKKGIFTFDTIFSEVLKK